MIFIFTAVVVLLEVRHRQDPPQVFGEGAADDEVPPDPMHINDDDNASNVGK